MIHPSWTTPDLIAFLIWGGFCMAIALYSIYRIDKAEKEREKRKAQT